MAGRTLLVVCLALVGIVQGYTLRDILRERALRRFREFDAAESQPYSELETRALKRLRDYHFRRMFDESKNVPECEKDLNPDCAGYIAEIDELEQEHHPGYKFCEDKDLGIQAYVKQFCRRTCNVDNCAGPNGGNIQVPHPGACGDAPGMEQDCLTFHKLCSTSGFVYYMSKYCRETCGLC